MINFANKRGGFGFTDLFVKVLEAKTVEDIGEFRSISAPKKSITEKVITPIYCACINPNPDILKALVESCSEYTI